MKLHYSPTSPFVRKVSICLKELYLQDRVQIEEINVWAPDTTMGTVNPLGKVPALTLDDGHVLVDSPVICEYLDALVPGVVLFPAPGKARWKALYFQALGDGIMEAAVLHLLENRRPKEEQSASWKARQLAAIDRALDVLEQEVTTLAGGPLTIGQISVAVALGYLGFRMADLDLLTSRPALKEWYEWFATRPSMRETVPQE